jgi:hypothetical protein
MQAAMKVKHVVVDGSNIATEGRDAPSLAQLDEAVQAFVEEYSPTYVTVVVDATFPNRIDRKERQTYEDAVNANELITPPAGAIGRGDAFILQIARRADAAILSNDSFQEFHGEYPWLFEKGRLIGGKPVPHVGWVFMDRAPVRGPTSRRAVSEARKSEARKVTKASKTAVADEVADDAGAAAEPSTPPPAPRKRRTRAKAAEPAPDVVVEEAAVPADVDEATSPATASGDGGGAGAGGRVPKGVAPYNEALAFIEFVGQHPVGSEVDAEIERFSSHGAYVLVGAARAYVPLRNLAHPAPRSAKEVLRIGDTRQFVVVAIDPPRRGIDLALPGVAAVAAGAGRDEAVTEALAGVDGETPEPPAGMAPAKKAAGRKSTGRKSAAGTPRAEKAPAKKASAKKAAGRTSAGRKSAAGEAASVTGVAGDDSAPTEGAGATAAGETAGAPRATRSRATRKATARKAAAAGKASERAGPSDAGKASGARKASGASEASESEKASRARKASGGTRASARKASSDAATKASTGAGTRASGNKASTAAGTRASGNKASSGAANRAARKKASSGTATTATAKKASRARKSAARKATPASPAARATEVGESAMPEVITLARGSDDGAEHPEHVSEAAGG